MVVATRSSPRKAPAPSPPKAKGKKPPPKPRPRGSARGKQEQDKLSRGWSKTVPWCEIPELKRVVPTDPCPVNRAGNKVPRAKEVSLYMEFARRGGGRGLVRADAFGAEDLNAALETNALLRGGAAHVAHAVAVGGNLSGKTLHVRETAWRNLECWALMMLPATTPWVGQLRRLEEVLYAPGPGVETVEKFELTVPVPPLIFAAWQECLLATPPVLPHPLGTFKDVNGNPQAFQFMSTNPTFAGRGVNGRMISGQHMRGMRNHIFQLENMLLGTSDVMDSGLMLAEKKKRSEDKTSSAGPYLVDVELPNMYKAVWEEGKMNGVSGFGSAFQMQKVWTMMLLAHVLFARVTTLTEFCPRIEDIEFGPAAKDSMPTFFYITIRRWKNNAMGDRWPPCRFKIKRNLNKDMMWCCPVFHVIRWLTYLSENDVEQGPLFPFTVEGTVKFPLEEMKEGQWKGWVHKVFDRVGGLLATCSAHSIRRSGAQWAGRCGADLDAILQGGLWVTYDNLLTYIQEGRLTAKELVAEQGEDPIFKFWVWERTRFATTATRS